MVKRPEELKLAKLLETFDTILCTPKCFSQWGEDLVNLGFRVTPTAEIYINMMGGMTEADCDAQLYFLNSESMKTKSVKFRGMQY